MLSQAGILLIDTPSGRLEAVIEHPILPADITARMAFNHRIIIICHPHPLQGGTMNNKVVTTLARLYRELMCITIRFNYRGVGKSEGQYDQGKGETADALHIIDWAVLNYPNHAVELAGFSFGSYISLNAAIQTNHIIQRLVNVAPAVNHMDFSALQPKCPWIVVTAGQDAVVPSHFIYDWIETRNPKPDCMDIPCANHFFDGQLITLKQLLKTRLI